MENVVIFGNSEFSKLVHHYVTVDGGWDVCAFTVDRAFKKEDTFCGLPLVPFDEIQTLYPPPKHKLLLAIGYGSLNKTREQKYKEAKELGYELPSYVHHTSHISSSSKIGDSCLILEQNAVQPFAELGNNIVLWSNNAIGHGCVIHNHVFFTSGILCGSYSAIGERTFLGMGVTLNTHLVIGKECIIGAGSLVMSNADDSSVFRGAATAPSRVPSYRLPNFN